jgi:hypothetical protein
MNGPSFLLIGYSFAFYYLKNCTCADPGYGSFWLGTPCRGMTLGCVFSLTFRLLFKHILYFLLSAPETQHKSVCSISSDLFSFGMLMASLFNGGQSVIQANHSTSAYFKQAGVVSGLIRMDKFGKTNNGLNM